jgi:dUTP pyrophosphatase
VNVKIKLLNENAVVPEYQTDGAVAVDLVATSETINVEKGYISYGTGIAIEIPEGHEAQIRPRSSIRDKDLFLCNSPGTIDFDFRGEVFVTFKPTRPMKARKYQVGERIAQLVICPIVKVKFTVVDELTETKRGSGGFGSTNK